MSADKMILIVSRLADLAIVAGEIAAQIHAASLVIQRARDENRDISDEEWLDADMLLADAKERAKKALEL